MKLSKLPSLEIAELRAALRDCRLGFAEVIEQVLDRIAGAGDDRVWIERVPAETLRRRAAELDALAARTPEALAKWPLLGIPFAVKDNIDVVGMPTSAGCPAFAYTPEETAPAVASLIAAGAVLVGKTNLDQFATGLVGTRSPYGVPRNPFDARYVPGGSSSGSAVAVAAGLVSFALGTDTAGSGRVPAAFNNIVGLKPTRGRISIRGVVPACRSLDCVSIFALTVADAAEVLEHCGTYDVRDPFMRAVPEMAPRIPRPFRFAVPRAADREFFGDSAAAALFIGAISGLRGLGGVPVEIDMAPLHAASELLYGGPWVAERLGVVDELLARAPEALLPVTREIIAGGARYTAVDAFKALYRLAELKREIEPLWEKADVLVLPTAPTIYALAEVEADPIGFNSRLGLYTNFVNLLDLAAIAVPAGFRPDGLPLGISLIAPAFGEEALSALAAEFTALLALPPGAAQVPQSGRGMAR